MATSTLLTIDEAAELLRMVPRRLKRLAKRKAIPCIALPDGEYRFDHAELLTWIAEHRQGSAT